ncbi:MAG: hypothetical protein EHM55_00155 [Acidobacteria bacterium]|nr:MAG: hypothetical protein EHM55_00155 [Acidobacteriota bacterium]
MKDIHGVVTGIVREIDAARAAVKVEFPWLSPSQRSHWARIATLMGGKNRGVYYMPEEDDEVLVAFEHGKFDHPYVVGFLYNGVDVPPESERRLRVIRSVNGHEIAIYDAPPSGGDLGFVRIKDAHGNVIELANAQIRIISVGALQIKAPTVSINGRIVAPIGPPI